jgi:glycosyltransferase involved in cell wall biosynthesis
VQILWHSNAPWAATGYGQQTALNVPLLRDQGHDVAVSAFYGVHGAILTWDGLKVYPAGYDAYGNDVMLPHAQHHFGGDTADGLIITLVDVWVLNGPQMSRANVACWTPVDHDPVPKHVVAVLEESGATPIAMSRFGQRALEEAGLQPLYVPHSVDTDVYRPVDRAEARATMGIPQDAFLVGMVAANKGFPPRKGFPEALQAFAEFRKTRPDALLYLHTEPHGYVSGTKLLDIAESVGLGGDCVKTCDPYNYLLSYPQSHMAHVYSAMDVLLNPARGEGFGIPIVEAQACGTPVIVTDWTAMSELCGAGWKVDGDRWWSEQGSWQKVPAVDEIVLALDDAYDGAAGLRQQAREFALGYDHRTVAEEHWRPALDVLARRMETAEPVAA